MTQFQIWDGIITSIFVEKGIARESNPFMINLVSNGDFLWFKIVGALILCTALFAIGKYFPKLTLAISSSITAFYLAVIIWNFTVIYNSV
jgi:hypothetical protein